MTDISDKLTIQEELEIWRKFYERKVKPLINQGEYMIASFELGNITYLMLERKIELLNKVHSGGSYVISAKILEEKLQIATSIEDVKDDVEIFEAYQAQTKLQRTD